MIALVTIGAALIALAEYLDTIPHAAGDVAEGALAFSADGRTASLAAAPQPADWPLPFAVSFQPWPACLAASYLLCHGIATKKVLRPHASTILATSRFPPNSPPSLSARSPVLARRSTRSRPSGV